MLLTLRTMKGSGIRQIRRPSETGGSHLGRQNVDNCDFNKYRTIGLNITPERYLLATFPPASVRFCLPP